ncbi:oligosaccharide flippase family protein [uncultured Flavobacterium sp.]|uniref:lipopolysaccharide biosynthesis protein n=1 Tax=uncultured Flavobacterium sp. TaxID=165435 RepID=UPI0030EED169|tara:strand:- start:39033 stop:40346 length:1314 start_codon:yes stop_codon:yes gene_type:complete
MKKILENHLIMSGLYKAASGLSLFLSIRILIDFLGVEEYGLWVLIFTIFQWVLLMDFGIQSSLKTKIPVLLHENKLDLLKSYIKTTYKFSTYIGFLIFVCFLIFSYLVDLKALLNIENHTRSFINKLFILNVSFFCLNFIINIQKSLNVAFLKGKYAEQSIALNQFGFFILLLILVNTFSNASVEEKLILITMTNGIFALIINIVYTYTFFKREQLNLKTKTKTPALFVTNLLKLGSKYMLIELGIIFIFTSDNYIISNVFGTSKVTVYEVVNKLFQFPFLILFAGLSPLWSMFAKHYIEKNKNALLVAFKKFNLFYGAIVIAVTVLALLIPFILSIWLKEKIEYPSHFILLISLVTLIRIYVTFYTFFLNGIGKLNLYILFILISVIIKIPLSYFFVDLGFDINSVVLSSLVIMVLWVIFIPYKCYKIVNSIAINE